MLNKKIFSLFGRISLAEIDSLQDVQNSKLYLKFLSIFPNLEEIFNLGYKENPQEFVRTIKHVFRAMKIISLIHNGKIEYSGLSALSIDLIKEKYFKINEQVPILMVLILAYHDIGKLVRKRDHPQQSFELILNNNLLDPFKLDDEIRSLILKIIQYHVLFATIYTGESTFYGIFSLVYDSDFLDLTKNHQNLEIFVDSLEVFTYIDILGYSYSRIFDHYIDYYEEINYKLKEILFALPNKEAALEKAFHHSQSWLEWRLAGALRIFQFITTKPHLTKDFYFEKLRASTRLIPNTVTKISNWENIREQFLEETYKVQLKYGLAFLMILAFGSFHRAAISQKSQISPNLISFWILLIKRIKSYSERENNGLWNVNILGIKNWFKVPSKTLEKVDLKFIEVILKNSTIEFNENLNEWTINVDISILEDLN